MSDKLQFVAGARFDDWLLRDKAQGASGERHRQAKSLSDIVEIKK